MIKRGYKATWRVCLVCGGSLERRDGERLNKWHGRQTCSEPCKRIRQSHAYMKEYQKDSNQHYRSF